jgi:predicted PurR-regulated permease PerM
VVGSIDNFLRPFLMRCSAGMSPFWIFMAILGGVQLFGLAGLLYGPLIVGFAMVMLMIYEEEFQQYLQEKDQGQVDAPRAPVRRRTKPTLRVSPRRPRPKNMTD